jgi:hypothetical protein
MAACHMENRNNGLQTTVSKLRQYASNNNRYAKRVILLPHSEIPQVCGNRHLENLKSPIASKVTYVHGVMSVTAQQLPICKNGVESANFGKFEMTAAAIEFRQ